MNNHEAPHIKDKTSNTIQSRDEKGIPIDMGFDYTEGDTGFNRLLSSKDEGCY